ncbi:MAG: hypothetical protein LBI09_00025 [Nitrososphaerota archaeon]|nr:hypothetical protein [Nitrososphaerota archaeon]
MAVVRKLWRNDIFRTACTLALIPIIIIGFWATLPRALNTDIFPLFVVVSGSMCIPEEPCTGISVLFSHTFERTLHKGDILVIQGVNAKDLKTDYPDSDIIVFRDPVRAANEPNANIVHRIIDSVEVNGKLYFYTKGDGNGYPNVWPQTPQSRDHWRSVEEDLTSTYDDAISQDYVYGKVVMRIPLIGAIAMQSQKNNMITVILGILIVLLITFEFILPLVKKRKRQNIENITITSEKQSAQDINNGYDNGSV